MKLHKLLIPVAILAFTVWMTSCSLIGSPTGSNAEKLYTARDVARMFPAIGITEPMTYGLACRILENDVTGYCEFPWTRPEGFPAASLCRIGAQVCREVLGEPPQPSAPPPPHLPNA